MRCRPPNCRWRLAVSSLTAPGTRRGHRRQGGGGREIFFRGKWSGLKRIACWTRTATTYEEAINRRCRGRLARSSSTAPPTRRAQETEKERVGESCHYREQQRPRPTRPQSFRVCALLDRLFSSEMVARAGPGACYLERGVGGVIEKGISSISSNMCVFHRVCVHQVCANGIEVCRGQQRS